MVPYSLCVALCPNGLVYIYMARALDPLKVYIAGVHANISFAAVKKILRCNGHRPTACFVIREWPI